MSLEVIGPSPFERNALGQQVVRIGTIFTEQQVLYTALPGVHAWQRASFVELLNSRRAASGAKALTEQEEDSVTANSVDLIFEPDHILIRPDPSRMELAFEAGELLEEVVSKRQIKFLSVSDPRVREAIKRRGECWRLSGVPKTRDAKNRLVMGSKVGIHGRSIYFYNRLTGTRWLTYHEFERLESLGDPALAAQLQEIADHVTARNRQNRPEVDFFAADLRRFGANEFDGTRFDRLPEPELRTKYADLRDHFRSAVHETFRRDDCGNKAWVDRMLSTLFLDGNETQAEQVLSGLSPEFFMQVEWLPGGRFEEGEFLFDPIFEEAANEPDDQEFQRLGDLRAKGIILNFIRDYGDLEYINVGCVPESLSLDRPQNEGRRGVYLAEFRSRNSERLIKRLLRLQKWGVWEHLDEGKSLLQSMLESDEYTDYWLDRRLGCRQLGMNVSRRVFMRRLTEIYTGSNARYRGQTIRTTYFEREYVPGVATDKLPVDHLCRPGYAPRFAALLGQAGASSLIVGRSFELGTRPVFDDGDEVVLEDEAGLPTGVLVCDHSGAFGEYKLPLEAFAVPYARPVNVRARLLPNPQEFARIYLAAFGEKFVHIQEDYRKRRRAFESLFKEAKYDPAGSFAFRWECVLRRLEETRVDTLIDAIRQQIHVLSPQLQPA